MRCILLMFAIGAGAMAMPPQSTLPVERTAKPACSCGESCKCENGRIDPRCACENCKCAIVSGSRGNVEEISHRPCEANAPKTSTTAKAGTKGCVTCGPLCECGDGCLCGADYWKDYCKAVPPERRAPVQQAPTYYYQPTYRQTYQPAYQLPTYYTPRGTAANCGPTG
jgi:hypothetical protein